MANNPTIDLAKSPSWAKMKHNIENTLGTDYVYSEDAEKPQLQSLYEDSGEDVDALLAFAIEQLRTDLPFDEAWCPIKSAAILLTNMAKGFFGAGPRPDFGDAVTALWYAAETKCGLSSRMAIKQEYEDDKRQYKKHKFALDSIFFALANTEAPHQRMETFFNCGMSDYWKSFFANWDVLWHQTSPQAFFDQGGHLINHKVRFYKLLAYRLRYFDTEFNGLVDKVEEAYKLLTRNPSDIPEDREMRIEIYQALSTYLQGKQYENTHIFNEVFKVLKQDTISFILTDEQYQRQEAGKVLLNANDILESTWDLNNRMHGDILPAIMAAMDHNDVGVQRKAKEFLKKRAPNEVQKRLERMIDELDKKSNFDEASNLISNLVEFGSQVAIKVVLRKCVLWIAGGENWPLIEQAAHKLREAPSAVQPLLHELNFEHLNRRIHTIIRSKVIAEQDNVVISELFHPKKKKGEDESDDIESFETAYDRFKKLDTETRQARYLEELQKWVLSLEERSKAYADQITLWRSAKVNGEPRLQDKQLVELADKLLQILIKEKSISHQKDVRIWITNLLSQMSDRRYFDEDDEELFEDMQASLKRFAIGALSKRLPVEDDLEVREDIVRVLANVGGPTAVDTLVRTVSGKERERKARQDLLAEYYLQPSKARSEEAAVLLNDAVENAKKTMRLLQILNSATFSLGAILILGGVVIAVSSESLGTRFVGLFSSMGGMAAIITIFLKDPLRKIQDAMGDLVQIQTAFTGFVWDLNLNGTYIQSQYVAEGTLSDYDIRQTTGRIAKTIDKTMNLIQVYAEGEYDGGPPRLSYMLPLAGANGNTLTIFGENLKGEGAPDPNRKCQIAINHQPIEAALETWNDHFVILSLPMATIEELKAKPRLWVSLIVGDVETNALPVSMNLPAGMEKS